MNWRYASGYLHGWSDATNACIMERADAYRLSGRNVEANIYFSKAMAINPTSDYNGEPIRNPAIGTGQGCTHIFRCLASESR